MRGIVSGVQCVAVVDFFDGEENVGSFKLNIPNSLAVLLIKAKEMDRVIAMNARTEQAVPAKVETVQNFVTIKYGPNELQRDYAGKTVKQVFDDISEALHIPKRVSIMVDGMKAVPQYKLHNRQTLEFVPRPFAEERIADSLESLEKLEKKRISRIKTKLDKEALRLTRSEAKLVKEANKEIKHYQSIAARNKALLKDKNRGMSGRELAKKYHLTLPTVYGIRS